MSRRRPPREAPPERGEPAGASLLRAVEQLLYREARLLDEERYEAWLDLLTADFHYRMPAVSNRYRADPEGAVADGRIGLYDDDRSQIEKRIARLASGTAWAEDPPTRHARTVTNIEAYEHPEEGEVEVFSVISSWRSRGERDDAWIVARRHDRIRREADGRLRIAHRTVRLAHAVLPAKNLNVFL